MTRLDPKVRWWTATSRSLSRFAPARRHHARRPLILECLEDRTVLSTIAVAVNTIADDTNGPVSGQTTLRDAITQADADTANQYVVTFSVTGTIDLTSPLPALSNNIDLKGPGASDLTVQRDPGAAAFSVFTVDSDTTVTLSGMTITGGNANGNGGGIDNSGTLTVSGTTFAGNSASAGGGIANELGATATISDSTFNGNSASSGGGIDNGGTATVINSTIINNSATTGGGLYNWGDGVEGGNATLTNCTVSGNSSQDAGGGIADNVGSISLTLNNTIVAGNTNSGSSDNDIYGQVQPTSAFNLIGDGSGISNLGGLEGPAQSNLIGTTTDPLNPLLSATGRLRRADPDHGPATW